MKNRVLQGRDIEQLVSNFLISKGFSLIESNYNLHGGEIDLIMRDKDFIVFVEVKSLRKAYDYSIYSTLTKKKKRFLKHTIYTWLSSHNKQSAAWRVDFVGVTLDNDAYEIEHFEFIDLNN